MESTEPRFRNLNLTTEVVLHRCKQLQQVCVCRLRTVRLDKRLNLRIADDDLGATTIAEWVGRVHAMSKMQSFRSVFIGRKLTARAADASSLPAVEAESETWTTSCHFC